MFISLNHASEWRLENGAAHYYGAMTSEFSAQIDAMLDGARAWLEDDQAELAALMRQIEDWRARISAATDQITPADCGAPVDAGRG